MFPRIVLAVFILLYLTMMGVGPYSETIFIVLSVTVWVIALFGFLGMLIVAPFIAMRKSRGDS